MRTYTTLLLFIFALLSSLGYAQKHDWEKPLGKCYQHREEPQLLCAF